MNMFVIGQSVIYSNPLNGIGVFSNLVILLARVPSGRSIVRTRGLSVWKMLDRCTGALNWATGETVAVKEIQLSNIPKGELPEIMVSAFV